MRKITKTILGYTFDWYQEKELLILFPESKTIIPEKISEYEQLIKEEEEKISKLINNVNNATKDEFSRWFCKQIIIMQSISTLLTYDSQLLRLKRQLNYLYPRNDYTDNFQEKIYYAKSRPIHEVIGQLIELKKIGNDYVAVCPFHPDKRPSLRIYTKGNNFYCFGCHKGGSAIDFVMEIQGCSFGEAVKYLQN